MCDTRYVWGSESLYLLKKKCGKVGRGNYPSEPRMYGGGKHKLYKGASGRPITVWNPPYTPTKRSYKIGVHSLVIVRKLKYAATRSTNNFGTSTLECNRHIDGYSANETAQPPPLPPQRMRTRDPVHGRRRVPLQDREEGRESG